MEETGLAAAGKRYFSMGEMSRIVRVAPHTLRYWEHRLGRPRPSRRPSGHRRYTREDVETIGAIRDMIYRRRMTLDGVRRALSSRRKWPAVPRTTEELPLGGQNAKVSAETLKVLQEVRKEIQTLLSEMAKG